MGTGLAQPTMFQCRLDNGLNENCTCVFGLAHGLITKINKFSFVIGESPYTLSGLAVGDHSLCVVPMDGGCGRRHARFFEFEILA